MQDELLPSEIEQVESVSLSGPLLLRIDHVKGITANGDKADSFSVRTSFS
jgi:hypothetical protein